MDIKKIKENLHTDWLGHQIHFDEKVDSTNRWAARSMQNGAKRGNIFLTDYQTAGYGREQKLWESPAGKNILFSFFDDPPADAAKSHHLTLIAGLGILEGLRQIAPTLDFQLKWPNDLLLNKKKVGGILTEQINGLMVIGVGINVNMSREEFSSDIQEKATSIYESLQQETSREKLISACLMGYEKWRETYNQKGMKSIIEAWEKNSAHLNQKVRVCDGKEEFEGIAMGLDPNGFLLVREGEKIHSVIAGDVSLLDT